MKLVQSLKVRISRPLPPHTWEQVGPRLRELGQVAHRVLNRTMTSLAIAAEFPEQVPAEWKSKNGKASAYQMAARALDRVNEDRVKVRVCKWCLGTRVEPFAHPLDANGKPVKRTKRQPERAPGATCSRCDGAGSFAVGEPVAIPSAIERDDPQPRSGPSLVLTASRLGIEVSIPGRKPRVVYGAETIRHHRAKLSARRASRSKHQRDISAGARGHGRARALEHYHAIDDAEHRWVRSLCQQIAAAAVKAADLRGASWVTVDEDAIGKLLPPARMRDALSWALRKAGYAEPIKDLTEPGKPEPEKAVA